MKIRGKNNEDNIVWQTFTSIQRTTDVEIVSSSSVSTYAGSNVRLRVTKFGHILLEAEDMFIQQPYSPFNQTFDTSQEVQQTSYTIIWSNVPKHMRYQIGTFRGGYHLVLEESAAIGGSKNADLVLYDGGGSIVWCALLCNSPVSNGFRFPDNYLLPVDIPTDTLDNGYTDGTPHNTLDPTIEYVKGNSFLSQNQPGNCGPILVSGQGINSPNGRFKLILQNSGNLILKDGIRTMWESMTSNRWFAEGPYSMRLSNRGILYVVDKWNKLTFSTALPADQMQLKNTKLTLEDSGDFVISHSLNGTIVTNYFSLPQYNLFNDRFHVCYSNCQECLPMRPPEITKLWSNGSDYSPYPLMFNNTEKLCSPSGSHCVEFKDKVLGISSNTTFFEIKKFEQDNLNLAFDLDGRLQIFGNDTSLLLWNNTNRIAGTAEFTSTISDSGRWSVFDHFGKEVWFTAQNIPEGEVCESNDGCRDGKSCCVGPNELIKKCRATCLTPIEDGNLCNGKTDFCSSGGSCCIGSGNFQLKCRPADSCVALLKDNEKCVVDGIPCETGTCCFGSNDFENKCRSSNDCISLLQPGQTCVPDGIPCIGGNSCCFGENDHVNKCRASDTCIKEVKIGESCIPGGAPCSESGLCCFGENDSVNKCRTACPSFNVFDFNRPGQCITVNNGKLKTDYCDDSKFAFIDGKMQFEGNSTLCISGNTDQKQLSLVLCDSAAEFSYNKFADLTIRLLKDDTKIMDGQGEVGKDVFLNQYTIGLSTTNDKQQFVFNQNEVRITFVPIYSVRQPGLCMAVEGENITLGSCDDPMLAFINQKLVYQKNRNVCVSVSSQSNQLILDSCDKALVLVYEDPFFVFAESKEFSIISTKSGLELSKSLGEEFTFDISKVKYVFDGIYDINHLGSCIAFENDVLYNGPCGTSTFAFYNNKIISGGDRSQCVTIDPTNSELKLARCDLAVKFSYNKYADFAFRVFDDDRYIIDIGNSTGDAVKLYFEKDPSKKNISETQQFSLTNIISEKFTPLYSARSAGYCIEVGDDDFLMWLPCDIAKFSLIDSKLVYNKNPHLCISGKTNGEKMKLETCNTAVEFTYDKFKDETFRLVSDERFAINADYKAQTVNLKVTDTGATKNSDLKIVLKYQEVSFDYQYIYDIQKPGHCATLSSENILTSGTCFDSVDDKFAFVLGKLISRKNNTLCLSGNLDSLPLSLLPCEKGGVYELKNNNLLLKLDNVFGMKEWEQIGEKIHLVPFIQENPFKLQELSFSAKDVGFDYKNIYVVHKPNACVTVSLSSHLELGECDVNKFAFVNNRFVYNQDPVNCVHADINGDPMTLIDCEHGTKFVFVDSTYKLMENQEYSMVSGGETGSFVVLGMTPSMSGSKDEERRVQHFSQTFDDVQLPFSALYSVEFPGKCIIVDNLQLKYGECDYTSQFALYDDRLIFKNDRTKCLFGDVNKMEVSLVSCDSGSLFSYNKESKTFGLKEDVSFVIDANAETSTIRLIRISLQEETAPTAFFSFLFEEVHIEFHQLYDINKPGLCVTASSDQLLLGNCEMTSRFAYINSKFHYSEDREKCISGSPNVVSMFLVPCEKAEKFVMKNDFSIRLQSSEEFAIDDFGEIGKPIYLFKDQNPPNNNRMFSFEFTDINFQFHRIRSKFSDKVCLTVANDLIVFGPCSDSIQFAYYQEKFIFNMDKSKCIFGSAPWEQLKLAPCDQGSLFTLDEFNDGTVRFKELNEYGIGGSLINGTKVYLTWLGKAKSTNSENQFDLL
jgi:hypothetical protein